MKKKLVLGVLGVLFFQFLGLLYGAIPASERAILIELYNSTNGDGWTSNAGWKTAPLDADGFAMPGTEGFWFGITVESDHVTDIVLNGNQLSGIIPSTLGNLSSLTNLALVSNELTGPIPSQLGNLNHLLYLHLSENQLSGTIPTALSNLSNLKILALGRNALTGSIPSQLGNLSSLTELYLYENLLSGSIPSQLGNLSQLQKISLASNQLSGTIPTQLSNLTQLLHLLLNSNQLTGSIPSQLGNLSHLQYLYLQNNQLTGSIPSTLGNLASLEELLLSYNQLSGSIPSQIGNLSNLLGIWLNDNHLTGLIPTSLTNLSKIIVFDIGFNCLVCNDSTLKTWLDTHDPDWNAYQNQCGGVVVKPTVTTGSVATIAQTSAVCGGNVTGEGVTPVIARGVCWDTEINPTINDKKTTDGSGTGLFTSTLTQLTQKTLYYVRAYATNSNGTAYGACVSFTTLGYENPPTVTTGEVSSVTDTSAVCGGNVTADGGATVTARGVCWSTVKNPTIGNSKTNDGTGTGSFTSNLTGLTANTRYYARAYATNSEGTSYGASTSFVTASSLGETQPPFGFFETPVDGSTVAGSIAVTGWALDDSGLDNVKIYLVEGDTQTFIGDAVFVEGARPDIAVAYPDYPNNSQAGWGYMMLTHFLPGGGNGTYVLAVRATDLAGKTTELGRKTIIINNAHAYKPFGAIDTPTQGGIASGTAYVNWGWVLTPQPYYLLTNGSTIDVWVDGVNKGHPVYNNYRSDIATLFPGYANSNGAVGYFYLDTTKYSDGVHTIQWTATDAGNNTDGIGSRYFTIQNTSSDVARSSALSTKKRTVDEIMALREEYAKPILFSKGYDTENGEQKLARNEKGNQQLIIEELGRVALEIGQNAVHIEGYVLSGNQLQGLPIGSTLDKEQGKFYWSVGPGFLGYYSLVFVLTDENGVSYKKSIDIKIEPKFND